MLLIKTYKIFLFVYWINFSKNQGINLIYNWNKQIIMSGWKQPTILSRNKDNLNCLLMILETNKKEGEEYLYYSFKTNDSCSNH